MESKEIVRARKRLERLNNHYKKYLEKLDYYRHMVKRCKENMNRGNCSCCGHEFTPEETQFFRKYLPIFERKVKIIESWVSQNYNHWKICRIKKPITELEERQRKAWKQEVIDYLQNNRNNINKSIRTLELPEIIDNKEKKLWNAAIELQIDKRNIQTVDENEVQFEI